MGLDGHNYLWPIRTQRLWMGMSHLNQIQDFMGKEMERFTDGQAAASAPDSPLVMSRALKITLASWFSLEIFDGGPISIRNIVWSLWFWLYWLSFEHFPQGCLLEPYLFRGQVIRSRTQSLCYSEYLLTLTGGSGDLNKPSRDLYKALWILCQKGSHAPDKVESFRQETRDIAVTLLTEILQGNVYRSQECGRKRSRGL